MQGNSDNPPENKIKRVEKPKTRSATSTSCFSGISSASPSSSSSSSDSGVSRNKSSTKTFEKVECTNSNLFDTPPRDDTETETGGDIVDKSSDEVFTIENTNEAEAILKEINSANVQILSPLYSTSPLYSLSSTSPSWKTIHDQQINVRAISPIDSILSTTENSDSCTAGPSSLMAAPTSTILPRTKRRKKISLKSGRKNSLGIKRQKKVRHSANTKKIIADILDESAKKIKRLLLTNEIFGDSNSESSDETSSETESGTSSDESVVALDIDVKDNADHELLEKIHEKIANCNDEEMIQKVVDIVEECGQDLWTWTTESEITFDFDLYKLKPEAIQKIKEALSL